MVFIVELPIFAFPVHCEFMYALRLGLNKLVIKVRFGMYLIDLMVILIFIHSIYSL